VNNPIVIVAHPARKVHAEWLALNVGAEAIVWDSESRGAAHNHTAAWRWLADSGAPFGTILEDDVLPGPRFKKHLQDAMKHSPTPFLSLYLGRGRPPHWQQAICRVIANQVSFYGAPLLLSAQGYTLPREVLKGWSQVLTYTGMGLTIEQAISAWVNRRYNGQSTWSYPRYSLIDHLDGPTLIPDHGDGQSRNGKTATWMPGCGEEGKDLKEVRKAWLMAGVNVDWMLGSVGIKLREGDVDYDLHKDPSGIGLFRPPKLQSAL